MKTKTDKYLKKYKTVENGLSKHPVYFTILRKVKYEERTDFQKKNININYVWVRMLDYRVRWYSIEEEYMVYCPTKDYIVANSSTGGFRNDLENEYIKKIRYKKLNKLNEINI